jgi:tRNA threonylcarbamoyladenosine biosynthesis protein TsaE
VNQQLLTLQNISELDCNKLAQQFLPILKTGDIIALSGDLGAGKSTFARALIRKALDNEKADVPSPTFTLVQQYSQTSPSLPEIWHFDLYRLENPEEAYELGIEEAFSETISLIEWPQNLGDLLPSHCLIIKITIEDDEKLRTFEFYGNSIWLSRLKGRVGIK